MERPIKPEKPIEPYKRKIPKKREPDSRGWYTVDYRREGLTVKDYIEYKNIVSTIEEYLSNKNEDTILDFEVNEESIEIHTSYNDNLYVLFSINVRLSDKEIQSIERDYLYQIDEYETHLEYYNQCMKNYNIELEDYNNELIEYEKQLELYNQEQARINREKDLELLRQLKEKYEQ